jgi:glucose-1-phosphate cytidylyltransferase
MEKLKVVILCGGFGTRLREETEFKPKPLVQIGNKPILWHIMKHYSHFGFNDFILCLGYKGEMIKDYFLNYIWRANDFTINLQKINEITTHAPGEIENWNITFVDTGKKTQTGGRIKAIEKYIKEPHFLATYGDGVSDVDIRKVVAFHKAKGKIGTLTGLHPRSKYGNVNIGNDQIVTEFKEKSVLNDLINGGFFVFKKEIFNYLKENVMLEKEPFEELAKKGQLALYKHDGYWQCMDTFKEYKELNKIWNNTNAPWKVWDKHV